MHCIEHAAKLQTVAWPQASTRLILGKAGRQARAAHTQPVPLRTMFPAAGRLRSAPGSFLSRRKRTQQVGAASFRRLGEGF